MKERPAHFEPVAEMCVAGSVRIHIDRVFGLDEVPAALARVGEGRAVGKVVVGVARRGRGRFVSCARSPWADVSEEPEE